MRAGKVFVVACMGVFACILAQGSGCGTQGTALDGGEVSIKAEGKLESIPERAPEKNVQPEVLQESSSPTESKPEESKPEESKPEESTKDTVVRDAVTNTPSFSSSMSVGEWVYLMHIDDGPSESRLDVDGLDIDKDGNVFITGYFQGNLSTFPPTIPSLKEQTSGKHTKDIFVAKLSLAGKMTKLLHLPSTGFAGNGFDLAVDRKDSSLYLSGGFSGTLKVGTKQLKSTCTQGDGINSNAGTQGQLVLLKLDKTGAPVWSFQTDSKTVVSGGNEVSLDDEGRILQIGMMGFFNGVKSTNCDTNAPKTLDVNGQYTLDFDGGQFDTFITVINPTTGKAIGPPIKIGGLGRQRGKAVDFGAKKDGQPTLVFGVDVVGPTTIYDAKKNKQKTFKTFEEPGLTGTAAYSQDMLVGRMKYDGTLLWHRVLGSKNDKVLLKGQSLDEIKGVATDGKGDVLVAGSAVGDLYMDGKMILASKTLNAKSVAFGFVAKLKGDTGELVWIRGIGSDGYVFTCCELVVDTQDRVYLTPQVKSGSNIVFADQFVHPLDSNTFAKNAKIGMIVQVDTDGSLLSIRTLSHATTGTDSTTSELAVGTQGLFWTGTLDGSIKAPNGLLSSGAKQDGQAESETIVRFIYPTTP